MAAPDKPDGIHHLTEGGKALDRHTVVRVLLRKFDKNQEEDHYERYGRLRDAIRENIYFVLTKNGSVTRGLLWKVRELLIDMQAVMIGEGDDDPDLDKRFTRMRHCIDHELSVQAIPSPTVGEIWHRRWRAIVDFVRSGIRTVVGRSS